MMDYSYDDPYFNEPGYDGSATTNNPVYTSPGDAEQDLANDQVGAGGGYGMGGLVSGTGGGGGDWLSTILKMLGVTGKNGSVNSTGILSLLSALGAGVGGVMSNSATKKATDQVLAGYDKANQQVTGILGGAQQAYAPYTAMGANATAALPGAVFKPTGGFEPVQGASQFVRSSAGAPPQGRTLAQLYRGR